MIILEKMKSKEKEVNELCEKMADLGFIKLGSTPSQSKFDYSWEKAANDPYLG